MKPWFALLLAVMFVTSFWAITPTPSEGRAGGGESYSGGSRPSSGSGGGRSSSSSSRSSGGGSSSYSGRGGGGGMSLGTVVTIIIIFAVLVIVMNKAGGNSGARTVYQAADIGPTGPHVEAGTAISRFKRIDANFSETVFLDFVHLLYTQAQVERGAGNLDALAAYVEAPLRERLAADTRSRNVTRVDEVLVGSSRITGLEGLEDNAPRVGIQVEIESNFTEHYTGGATRIYARERWILRRKRGVLSKAPKEMMSLSCPSCGSPSEVRTDGTCPYCDKPVTQGDFQWTAVTQNILEVISQHQPNLTTSAPEVGTQLPDAMDPDYEAGRQAFLSRNPDFDGGVFEKRVAESFLAIQQAWSSGRWEAARPYETDHLFNMHRYWIEAYKRQGLANRLDDVRVERIVPVRFSQDAFFDSITVRIHASMRDYVVDASGNVVGGAPSTTRAFSEYWTFIRSVGSERASEVKAGGCPNCGAPLEITMAGDCPYCNTKITSGRFDWVLAAIEQDEAYGRDDIAILPGAPAAGAGQGGQPSSG